MHISVSGIRGKSSTVEWLEWLLRERGCRTIAKVTGDYPFWIVNGEKISIQRRGNVVLLDEVLGFKKLCDGYDVGIFENNAIRRYTMQVFNRMVKPDVAIMTNVRLDHTDSLGLTRPQIAQSLGYGVGPYPKLVLSGETDGALNEAMAGQLEDYQQFLVANAATEKEVIPMANLVSLVDFALQNIEMQGLTPEEKSALEAKIRKSLAIKQSTKGLDYFDGAKINDVDSTRQVFHYLRNQYPDKKFHVVAVFRRKRIERTLAFLPWFKELVNDEAVQSMHFLGYGAQEASRRVNKIAQVKKVPTREESIPKICERAQNESAVVFTVCNAVNDFIRFFRAYVVN